MNVSNWCLVFVVAVAIQSTVAHRYGYRRSGVRRSKSKSNRVNEFKRQAELCKGQFVCDGKRRPFECIDPELVCDTTPHCKNCLDESVTICGPTGGPTTNGPTDAPTTNGPTDAPTTNEPTDAPTTDGPTDAPTTDGPTDAPTTQEPCDTCDCPTRPSCTEPCDPCNCEIDVCEIYTGTDAEKCKQGVPTPGVTLITLKGHNFPLTLEYVSKLCDRREDCVSVGLRTDGSEAYLMSTLDFDEAGFDKDVENGVCNNQQGTAFYSCPQDK